VFDTSSPAAAGHLGSPNQACAGGGPGVGVGGMPNSTYENCEPLGNVLVVQESDKDTPDDNANGGTITFTFDKASDVAELVLFGVETSNTATVTVSVFFIGSGRVSFLVSSVFHSGAVALDLAFQVFSVIGCIDSWLIVQGVCAVHVT
jgi:hypothetical protein